MTRREIGDKQFYSLAARLTPWFGWGAALFGVLGLYVVFFVVPTGFVRASRAYIYP
jgi:hypothetical protein